jgi:ABC-type transport system involved in multi-copper enzyme maturation permease subunit
VNPVLRREVTERFRTRRAPWFLFAWTIGVGLIGYVAYLVSQQVANNLLGRLIATQYMGRFLFQAMALLMMTAVVLIVPGVTALSIVTERERQTLPLLQVTQLTPLQLVIGKLSSSLGYFLLLLVAVAPVVAIPLLFGGMSTGDVAAALGMMLATAITLGSVSIAISSRARSSRGAVAGSYAIAFVIAFLSLAVFLGELFLARPSDNALIPARGREFYSSWINPYVGMVDAIRQPLRVQTDFQLTPFTPFDAIIYARQGVSTAGIGIPGTFGNVEGDLMLMNEIARPLPIPGGGDELAVRVRRGPVWMRTLIIYAAITALALLRASHVVRAPARRILVTKRRRNV